MFLINLKHTSIFLLITYLFLLLMCKSFAEIQQVHFKTKNIYKNRQLYVQDIESSSVSPSSLASVSPSLSNQDKNYKVQSRDSGYFLSGGVSALGALLFIKVKAVLFVIAVILIIGLLTKVVGGYGLMCGIGGPCDGPFGATAHGNSESFHPSYKYADSYSPNYNPTGEGDEYYKRAMNTFDLGFLARIMKSVDFVDMTFNALDLEEEECRKKMVCEMDNSATHSPVITFLMESFKTSLEKYRSNQNLNATVKQDCEFLYPECKRSLNPNNLNFLNFK